jgi:hypothetical protein
MPPLFSLVALKQVTMTDLTKVILMIATAVVAMTLLVFAKEHVKYMNTDGRMPVSQLAD